MPHKCYKCGSQKGLTSIHGSKAKYMCEKCRSKSGYKHSMLGRYTFDGTPEWQEKHKESMKLILENRT